MLRYLRLYGYFLRFSFSRAMEFRIDFYFRIVMDIFYYIFQISFFKVLYLHTSHLGGWNEKEVMVFITSYLFMDSIFMTVFASNMWWFPLHINQGNLDYHLVRPASPLFIMSFKDFAANSFVNIFISAGLLIWALNSYAADFPGNLTAVKIILLCIFLFYGVILQWLCNLLFLIPVFWLHSNRGLGDLFYHVGEVATKPVQIFKGWFRLLLTTALPFGFITWLPAQIVFEGLNTKTAIHALLLIIGFSIFIRWFWKSGLKAYSSASS